MVVPLLVAVSSGTVIPVDLLLVGSEQVELVPHATEVTFVNVVEVSGIVRNGVAFAAVANCVAKMDRCQPLPVPVGSVTVSGTAMVNDLSVPSRLVVLVIDAEPLFATAKEPPLIVGLREPPPSANALVA